MSIKSTKGVYSDGTSIEGPFFTDGMGRQAYVFQPSLSLQSSFAGQPVRGTQSVVKSTSNKTAFGKFR